MDWESFERKMSETPRRVTPLTIEELAADAARREAEFLRVQKLKEHGPKPRAKRGSKRKGASPVVRPVPKSIRLINLFALLGLEVEEDDDKVIRRAFLARSKATHPDHGGNEDDFKRVVWAYTLLCKKDRRRLLRARHIPHFPTVPSTFTD